jgi:hypothetical protein
MKTRLFLLPLGLAFIISSCEKDDKTDLELNFKALYDAKPMVIGAKYAYAPPSKLFFEKFRFYLSDVKLVKENGETVDLLDVDLVNFTLSNLDSESAAKGQSILLKDVPTGTYKGIQLLLGLNETLNAKKPADFSPGDPLADTEPYWADWKSYIFTTMSGRADMTNDGTYEIGLAYHLGGNDCDRLKDFVLPITLKDDKTGKVQFEIDLKKVFFTSKGTFPIETYPQVHTQSTVMVGLADDYAAAFTVVK